MKKEGKLQLDLFDVNGKRINEKVDVFLRNQYLNDNISVSVDGSKRILIKNLYGAPQGLYRIEIDPPSYLPVSRFVNLAASKPTSVEILFPVDPKKVKKADFPKFADLPNGLGDLLEKSDAIFGYIGKKGQELYSALDDIRRAGLLNITIKTQATPLPNGQTVFPYIVKLNELRGDRFFAHVRRELREEVKNSVAAGLFREVSGALHHLPGQFDGFTEAGSFKTEDAYGNLQLTFFMKGEECMADIDIDNAAGLEHVFQVLQNSLSDRPTHPYDIHEILMAYQQLDPGYTLQV